MVQHWKGSKMRGERRGKWRRDTRGGESSKGREWRGERKREGRRGRGQEEDVSTSTCYW
jgi:hypothetical protein